LVYIIVFSIIYIEILKTAFIEDMLYY